MTDVPGGDPSVVDCIDLMDEITSYLEHAQPQARRDAIDAHLVDCPECAAAIEQFRRTILLAGELRADEVAALDDDLRSRFLDVFRRR